MVDPNWIPLRHCRSRNAQCNAEGDGLTAPARPPYGRMRTPPPREMMPRERMGSMMLQGSRPAAVPGHPRHGFDTGRSFLAARLNQLCPLKPCRNLSRIPGEPWSGPTTKRAKRFQHGPAQPALPLLKMVEPACSLCEPAVSKPLTHTRGAVVGSDHQARQKIPTRPGSASFTGC